MLMSKGRGTEDREARAKRAMRRAVFYIVFLIVVVLVIRWPHLILKYLP
jgi:hypothetical protein